MATKKTKKIETIAPISKKTTSGYLEFALRHDFLNSSIGPDLEAHIKDLKQNINKNVIEALDINTVIATDKAKKNVYLSDLLKLGTAKERAEFKDAIAAHIILREQANSILYAAAKRFVEIHGDYIIIIIPDDFFNRPPARGCYRQRGEGFYKKLTQEWVRIANGKTELHLQQQLDYLNPNAFEDKKTLELKLEDVKRMRASLPANATKAEKKAVANAEKQIQNMIKVTERVEPKLKKTTAKVTAKKTTKNKK